MNPGVNYLKTSRMLKTSLNHFAAMSQNHLAKTSLRIRDGETKVLTKTLKFCISIVVCMVFSEKMPPPEPKAPMAAKTVIT
ncbi:MAG: hypothetical protein PHH65_06550 [Eubacteriales bacterium]|nr:hypothetical protein [Eubacteriales bacterium]